MITASPGATWVDDADQVAHRPGRQEDEPLVPEALGDLASNSAVHRRIAALLLVADLGIGDRPAASPRLGRVWVSEYRSTRISDATRSMLPGGRRPASRRGEHRWSRLSGTTRGC